ncbi:MAG: pyridoxamine 5'-phosphate oxidase family protein [Planctomycetota bacterium]|nr:pyridoxamine 5'-phosphate oxidase family protein [Planctomycetota bacterium]
MATYHDRITPKQRALLESARLFFVASATPDLSPGAHGQGPLNLSPKGSVSLRVLDDHTVAYVDLPGSGNETARAAEAGGPITVMAMSTGAEDAAIVRLFGRARIEELPADQDPELEPHAILGRPRQLIVVEVESTATSCGYGVPVLSHEGERAKQQCGRRYKETP